MEILIFIVVTILGMCLGYFFHSFISKKEKNPPKEEPAPVKPPPAIETPLEKKIMLEEAIASVQKMSENISELLNLNEVGDEIVKTTCNMLNVEICALLLLDERSDTLSIIAKAGIEDEFARNVKIKRGDEVSGMVAKLKQAEIVNELENKRRIYSLKYDNCYKNTLVSLPLVIKNKALGVLNVSNRKNNEPFTNMDIEVLKLLAQESAVSLQNFKLFEEHSKNYLDTIITLAKAIDARDPYTYQHSNNVTKYSVRIAEELKLQDEEIKDIRYAGLLHDIGKIGIRDDILLKSTDLTPEERLKIETHPDKGEEIISSLPFLQKVAKIVRHHHERFDGKGYPDRLLGEDIDIGARILALADSFDAMTTKRLYHEPLSLEEAKDVLERKKGSQFDPELVDCFLQILEKEPNIFVPNNHA
jgi:putative nucleotidyltransferase with HDIG domain